MANERKINEIRLHIAK